MSERPKKIEYHYGFYGALHFRSRIAQADFIFSQEHELGAKPLRMDMLITKRGKEKLNDRIFQFFKEHNVIEYKSPRDGLDIHDFYKVQGYACIFQHMKRADMREMSVSIFRHACPKEMFVALKALGCGIKEFHPGIYYVTGPVCVPAQVIVTSRLPDDGYEEFKVLTKGAKREDVVKFLQAAGRHSADDSSGLEYVSAVLKVSMAANAGLYQKLKEESRMEDVFEKIFHRELTQARDEGIAFGEARGEARGISIGEARGISIGEARGISIGEARGISIGEERARRSIMENLIAKGMAPGDAAVAVGLSVA